MPERPHASKKPLQYTARVEYRAVQAEVERMLEQGHRAKAIFEEMSRNGKLTISYSTFCAYVRGGGQRPRKDALHNKRQSAKPRNDSAAVRREAPPGPFIYDKHIDVSKLA